MKVRLALTFIFLLCGGLLLTKRRKVEVALDRYNKGRKEGGFSDYLPQNYTDGSRGLHLPYDVPMYARVYRLLQETGEVNNTGPVEALKGWTVQLDAFTFGVTLYLRVGMDGTLKVFAKDGDGEKPVKLEQWDR